MEEEVCTINRDERVQYIQGYLFSPKDEHFASTAGIEKTDLKELRTRMLEMKY